MSKDSLMVPESYIEGIGDISFNLGMVRMNLVGLSHTEKDDSGNPVPETRQHLVMSLRGFLVSLAAMQNMSEKLVEAGVLQRRDAEKGTGKKKE
ncbi:MAG: hypothetical protein HQL63_13845 [Magnetococcales bacterium]|nr:hypothetical protein [Magnetococcales bacterium]MBF0322412.1 hypothetical protein [Magnetococcales bacterium]